LSIDEFSTVREILSNISGLNFDNLTNEEIESNWTNV
jgi:hypothetical protein